MISSTSIGKRAASAAVETPKINYKRASEYSMLVDYINALSLRYRYVELGSIGSSIMGRSIPVITLGQKKNSPGVLYVGGFNAADILSPAVLLRFIGDYADFLESGKRMYSVSMPYLYENRAIHVIPMLNPDGYVLRREGAAAFPNEERLIDKNGSTDFSDWKYNARGVDLERSFFSDSDSLGSSGVASEPEVDALCRYVKMASVGVLGKINLALSLSPSECGIKYKSERCTAPRSKTIGRLLERMSGCRIDEQCAEEKGFISWFLREIGKPAFNFGCFSDGEVFPEDSEEYVKVYAALREFLFSSPLLI